MRNLVMSKPENHYLRRRAAIKIEFDFNRKKKHSFFADNRLQVDQIKRKVEAKFNKSLFIGKNNYFKSQNNPALSSNQLDTLMWSYLGFL